MNTTERKIMCVCVCLWDRWCWWCETGIVCLVIGLLKCESSSWLMSIRHAIEQELFVRKLYVLFLKEGLRCQNDSCLLRHVISIIKRHFVYTQHCLPWPPTRKYLRVLICDWQLNDKNLERLMSIRKLIQLHHISFQRETNKRKKKMELNTYR